MDDQWHTEAGLEAEAPVIEVIGVFAQRLAVIGGQYGEGLVQETAILEVAPKRPDLSIGVSDLGVVASQIEPQIPPPLQYLMDPGPVDLLETFFFVDLYLRDRVEPLIVLESVLPLRRRHIGEMRIQVVDPEKVRLGPVQAVDNLTCPVIDRRMW